MIEILFTFQPQFQCGANSPMAEFQLEISVEDTVITLEVGQKVLLDTTNFEDMLFSVIPIANADCIIENPVQQWLEYGNVIPQVPGLYEQESLQELYNQNITDEFYYMSLFELGTSDEESEAFDLNDVVFLVNLVSEREESLVINPD